MAFILDETSCIDLLKHALVDRLAIKLLSEVTDSAKAGLVREGRLQADPTTKKSNILIRPGGKTWPDVLDTQGRAGGMGSDSPYSIGGPYGSSFHRRRVDVQLQLFYSNDTNREKAQQKADLTMSRIYHTIMTWEPRREVEPDSFGESVWGVQILENELTEGGGTGAFNWRGHVIVEFLTEIEPN